MASTEQLSILAKTLQKLKTASISLLNNMLPLMEVIDDENSSIIEEIKYRTDANESDILSWLHKTTLAMIDEAESTFKQIDDFAKVVTKGDKSVKKCQDKFPFLAEIWFGDTYDNKENVEALNELLNDLSENLENANEDYIIEIAVKHFVKKNNKK